MLNTLAHYLISFISTMNIKKQQAHYRYVIYIQYVLYSCNTYHVTQFSCMQWSLLNSMKHDFDYAQKYNQKTQLWLHFDQPNVCSCPTILTAIDICLGQKRNKDKAERKNNDYKTETKQRNYLETEIHRIYIFQNMSKSFRTSKLDWTLSYLVSSPRLTSACGFLQ